MKQTIEYLAIVAVAALLLGVAACGKKEAPPSGVQAKSAPKAGPRSVEIPVAQMQFLTIEAASAARAGDVLVLPGCVAFRAQVGLRAFNVQQELRILAITGGLGG